jgi:hypothetical protein
MITGIVSSKDIAANPRKSLDPKVYLCPTKDLDEAIARTERTLANAAKRLVKLKAEREQRLAGCQTIFPGPRGYQDSKAVARWWARNRNKP